MAIKIILPICAFGRVKNASAFQHIFCHVAEALLPARWLTMSHAVGSVKAQTPSAVAF